MTRFPLLLTALVTTLGLAACSGATTSPLAPANNPVHSAQVLPGDPCNSLFEVSIIVPPEHRDEIGDLPGTFLLNTCPPSGTEGDALMTLTAYERNESITIPGFEDLSAEVPTWNGTREIVRIEPDKGREIRWTMSASITTNSVTANRVDGTLSRVRTRWTIDRNGERRERHDTLSLSFSGFQISSEAPGAGQPGGDDNGGGQGADDGPGDDNGGDQGADDGPGDDNGGDEGADDDDHGGHDDDDEDDDDDDDEDDDDDD
ncbi:MAG: hypothetical protein GEEBNDBF_01161 [bacterium]|nr:hypothetical protein [bacterium]